jgi:flagellin
MNIISTASLRLASRLQQSTKRESSSLKQLSTGKNLGEGTASHALLLKAESSLSSAVRGLEQASLNISNASSLTGVAEGGLQNVLSNLQDLRALAVQAADGTLSAADRQSLEARAGELTSQIDATAGELDFNGTKLLDGTLSGQSVQVGANEGDAVGVSFPSSTSAALGTDTVDFSTAASSGAAITTIDAAISQVTSSLANAGSTASRLENAASVNSAIAEQLTAASSALTETDYAKALTQLKTAQIQVKSAAFLLAKDAESQGMLFKALIK